MSIVDLLLFVNLYACHTAPDSDHLSCINPSDKDTIIVGRAIDTKLSAAVLRNNELFFIKDLPAWQDTCYGKMVSITGKINNKSLLLTSHADSSSQISDISNIHIADREFNGRENEYFETVQNSQVRKGFQYTSVMNIRGANPLRTETILTYSLSDSAFCMFDAEVVACREHEDGDIIITRVSTGDLVVYFGLDKVYLAPGQRLRKGASLGLIRPETKQDVLYTMPIVVYRSRQEMQVEELLSN